MSQEKEEGVVQCLNQNECGCRGCICRKYALLPPASCFSVREGFKKRDRYSFGGISQKKKSIPSPIWKVIENDSLFDL